MKLAFYGSSLLSSYWNGAATYYRGVIKELAKLGYEVTFYEPDVYDRQQHRDIAPPEWCRVVVYPGTREALEQVAAAASTADIVVKASGVGFEDDLLMERVMAHAAPTALRLFWDVDAPATLRELRVSSEHPVRLILPDLDGVLTYGGGAAVIAAYKELGASSCTPIYNAADPETHHPVGVVDRLLADLAFLGNRLPDRESRVEEFFFRAAMILQSRSFMLGGSGWGDRTLPPNVRYLGHVSTSDHNGFNCSPLAVLNISRESMAETGFSPATRVFEAAAAGSCLITDHWAGIDQFFLPGEEILVARDGQDVAAILEALNPDDARQIGAAALARVLEYHTYEIRARQADLLFRTLVRQPREALV